MPIGAFRATPVTYDVHRCPSGLSPVESVQNGLALAGTRKRVFGFVFAGRHERAKNAFVFASKRDSAQNDLVLTSKHENAPMHVLRYKGKRNAPMGDLESI